VGFVPGPRRGTGISVPETVVLTPVTEFLNTPKCWFHVWKSRVILGQITTVYDILSTQSLRVWGILLILTVNSSDMLYVCNCAYIMKCHNMAIVIVVYVYYGFNLKNKTCSIFYILPALSTIKTLTEVCTNNE